MSKRMSADQGSCDSGQERARHVTRKAGADAPGGDQLLDARAGLLLERRAHLLQWVDAGQQHALDGGAVRVLEEDGGRIHVLGELRTADAGASRLFQGAVQNQLVAMN